MNRTLLYFDCANGISGDMTLGAMLDAGVDLQALVTELRRLPLEGWSLEAETVNRIGMGATRAHVILSQAAQPHRHYSDIKQMLSSITLPGRALQRAQKAFALLAEAEAAVHQISVDQVHFHEVGAVDAIIDIVGSMIAIEMLGAEVFHASPVVTGYGEVQCDHGLLPVPAPATARLLAGVPVEAGPVPLEMTTPTGAAILTSLAPVFGPLPLMRLRKTAYGAGGREIEGRTNYLRVLVGESLDETEHASSEHSHPHDHLHTHSHAHPHPHSHAPARTPEPSSANDGLHVSQLCLMTTEIDDMNPEWYGPLLDRLFDAGCLDASLESIQMKKNRPGVRVNVLAEPALRDKMIDILLRHSSTFGVKVMNVERYCLPRRHDAVHTSFGEIRVKIGYLDGEILKVSAEYEDCRKKAEEHGVPVAEVYQQAMEAISRQFPRRAAE